MKRPGVASVLREQGGDGIRRQRTSRRGRGGRNSQASASQRFCRKPAKKTQAVQLTSRRNVVAQGDRPAHPSTTAKTGAAESTIVLAQEKGIVISGGQREMFLNKYCP